MWEDIEKILLREEDILPRLDTLARQINTEYDGKELLLVALLNGSLIFLADLLRRISLPVSFECLRVSSYSGTTSTGTLQFQDLELPAVNKRHVLLIDDILETGVTLDTVRKQFEKKSDASSVRTCVLLKKRIPLAPQAEADYFAFEIENEFVVGYGLDYNERYRNLPFIATLNQEAISRWKP
ncbi:MAG: hypoxanthine phosphoribosyltransferase [Chthoniobacterales bacterium]